MKKVYSLPEESIINKIYVIRGLKVMPQSGLAECYSEETSRLKEQVRRYTGSFHGDLIFAIAREGLMV